MDADNRIFFLPAKIKKGQSLKSFLYMEKKRLLTYLCVSMMNVFGFSPANPWANQLNPLLHRLLIEM